MPDAQPGRTLDTPIGVLLITQTDAGIRRCAFLDRAALVARADLSAPAPHAERAAEQLAEYFAGERCSFDVPIDQPGTPFRRRVWAELRRLEYGEVISYGELARRVGNPAASRAVGAANGANAVAVIVPCHRVLASDGSPHGYGGGLWRKARLLELEGARAGLFAAGRATSR